MLLCVQSILTRLKADRQQVDLKIQGIYLNPHLQLQHLNFFPHRESAVHSQSLQLHSFVKGLLLPDH
jgi:hypothetical protein